MPTVESSGNLTGITVGVEAVIYNTTNNKWLSLRVSTVNMASDDITVIRAYVKHNAGGSFELEYESLTYTGAQTDPSKYIPPLPTDIEMEFRLLQSAGTEREYRWKVFSP